MKNYFRLALAVLAFSAWTASAAPALRGGKLEKLHDDSGARFGEYGVPGGDAGVLGASGNPSGLKFSRSTHRKLSGQSVVPDAGRGGTRSETGDQWRVRGGIAAIAAGVALFLVPLALGAAVPVMAASLLIMGGALALLYPWK